MVKTLLFNRLTKTISVKIDDGYINKYVNKSRRNIWHLLKAKRCSVHVNGYCGTELHFDTDCCIAHSTKTDICQVLKNLTSNLKASQKHRTVRNN